MAIGSLMSFQPQADAFSYETFYGLKEKPFGLNPDPRFLYNSPSHAAAFENVLNGIRRREGLMVLTGEIGTGKTMLCRAVLRTLGRRTFSAFVPDPFASREDLLKMLLIDFGAMSVQDLTTGLLKDASRTELSLVLANFLESLPPHDAYVVVVIDEAQNMTLPMIEETRILADSFGSKGHLQLMFVGQPELLDKLKMPEMRQVDQRVCSYNQLLPLGDDAVTGYIHHRLQIAGGSPERVLFPPEVIAMIHSRSGGVPRLINRICDRALQHAHRQQAALVDRAIVEATVTEIGPTTFAPTWSAIMSSMRSESVTADRSVACDSDTSSLEENFTQELDRWLTQDLRPATRKPAAISQFPSETAAADAGAPASGRAASGRRPRAIAFWSDSGRELRNETYVQRLGRVWAKRAAIAAVLYVAFKAAALGATTLTINFGSLLLDRADLPEVAARPALVIPEVTLAAPSEPRHPATVIVEHSPTPQHFVVAVGVFANADGADRLVQALTAAGLRAEQRPFNLRAQRAQQVVVGPFATRDEAIDGLQRLKRLGGHDDARVVAEGGGSTH